MSKEITITDLMKRVGRSRDFVSTILCRQGFGEFSAHSHFYRYKDCPGFWALWNAEYEQKINKGKRINFYDEDTDRNAAGLSGCICCGVYLGDFVQPISSFPEPL